MFKHPEEWAKVWAKDTGLPYDVALDAVKRSYGTRGRGRRLDRAAIDSEQKVADTFADLGLIPPPLRLRGYVDARFNDDLPPSTSSGRAATERPLPDEHSPALVPAGDRR